MKVLLRFLSILIAALVCFACPQTTSKDCLPPKEITATNITDSSALVNWTPVVGVSTYQLRLLKLVDTIYQLVSTDTVIGTSKTFNNLVPNSRYRVEVRSKCSDGSNSSRAASTDITTRGVIIDDVVFQDGPSIQSGSGCAGKNRLNLFAQITSGITLTLLPPSPPSMPSKVMRIRIYKRIGINKILVSEFAIARQYNKSLNGASWTLLHDDTCEKSPPSLLLNNEKQFTGSGVKLIFTRQGKQFSLDLDLNNHITVNPLPSNCYARVEIFKNP